MTTEWTEPRHGEYQSRRGGRVLHVCSGSTDHFCYSDGEYLGTEQTMSAARQRCLNNERGEYVMEPTTTEQAWSELRPKPKAWEWEQVDKHNWRGPVQAEEKLPPRIRRMDDRTWACYRDSRYLGSEATLELAQKRCQINEISQRNSVIRLWEQTHPGELPPALQMTDEERAEHWRRYPPVRANPARAGVPRTAARAGLEAEGGVSKAGRPKVAGRARSDPESVPQGVLRVKTGALIPKKPGSSAHGRWSVLWAHDGKTVSEYAKAGGNLTTLANAVEKKLVSVEEN